MVNIGSSLFDLGSLDRISNQETVIHALDPRVKVVVTLTFIVAVVSFGKHEVSGLMPFFIYPAVLVALADIPVRYLFRKLLIVSPFALMIGLFNPFLDREILVNLGPIGLSGGWISFISIMLRFALTVGAGLILIACTGFNAICHALEKMGAPRVFVIQLLFLYRYLFVLTEEASRMVRARALRSFPGKGMGMRIFGYLVGHLLLRTLDRAHRIHLAMLSRGFDGEIRILRPMRLGMRDLTFLLGWSGLIVAMRFYDLPRLLGNLVTGGAG
ncbi:MAG: cobalt ECF transporter T component CbiQ [Desulfobacterales bacterium]|nr:cobalt ECF transporter T component CbiQ [Desulfobacterales bacterium]